MQFRLYDAALEEVQGAEIERSNSLHQPAQEIRQGRGFRVEVHEDELLPGLHAHGKQAVLRAIERADALELRRALQRAIEAVAPAVIRTAKDAGRALRLGHDGRGVMAADVVERAQLVVAAAHDDQRFAGEIACDELAGLLQLIRSRHHLPRAPKDILALQFGDAFVHVPRSRNGVGLLQWALVVVGGEDVVQRRVHQ